MAHVFLSYVHENSEIVNRLAATLRSFGIETWLDRDQITPGSRWRDAIRKAIENGAFFIACFSSEYNQRSKTYMNEELTLAVDELRQRPTDQSWFVPVLLNECEVPDRNIGGGDTLRSIQYVRLYEDWEKGITQVLTVIQPGSAAVFRLIHELFDNSARVRIRAADNLAQMGKIAEQALPRLLELLDDKNETVSAAAADALGRIGIPENNVVLKLLSITSDNGHPYYPRMHANKSLVAIGTPAVPMLIKALSSNQSRISESALQTLIEIGEPAVDLLTEALDSHDPIISQSATRALGIIARRATKKDDAFSPGVARLINVLQHNPDKNARADAATALGRIGDRSAVPTLIEALADENYLCVSAALALGQISDPRAIGPLISTLANNDKFWVPRGAAAVALGDMGRVAESAINALTAALAYDTQNSGERWDVRCYDAVVDALNRIENPSAPSTLTGKGYRYEMWGIY